MVGKIDEAVLVVSSALPQTLVSGKIVSTVTREDGKSKSSIYFSNDPSDVIYMLEGSEDPSSGQRANLTPEARSTLRLQLTQSNFSVRLVPVISLDVAWKPQQLLQLFESTLIVCCEEKPLESPQGNLAMTFLFASILSKHVEINFDLDLVASALSTLSVHLGVLNDTFDTCLEVDPVPV